MHAEILIRKRIKAIAACTKQKLIDLSELSEPVRKLEQMLVKMA